MISSGPGIGDYERICQQFRAALHPLFVHGVSLYDETGDLLWLTASFGPTEDEAVHKAYEKFAVGSGVPVVGYDLGSARSAILFRIPNTGHMVGIAMVVVDTKVFQQYRRDLRLFVTKKLLHAISSFANSQRTSTAPKSTSSHTAPPFLASLASPAQNSAPAATLQRVSEAKVELLRVRGGDVAERPAAEIAGDKRVPKAVEDFIKALAGESEIEIDLNTARTSRRLTARSRSTETNSLNSKSTGSILRNSTHASQKSPKASDRRPALALVVQRLVPLNEGFQPVRCEVLWALPRRVRRMGKKDANARQIRMPPAMEWRALIEFCRWYRRQSQVWRDAMPFMWLKFSIGSVLDKSFISRAERCLKGSKFPADRLGFEIPAHEAAARVDDLSKVATSLEYLRCFIVLDNFSVQSDHMDLLRLPAVRMIKLAPEVGTAMRIDTWMRKRVAGVAQTTRALGIKMVVKRIASRSEALWYRDYGVEFVQSQALSPGEPINALADMGKPDSTSESTSR